MIELPKIEAYNKDIDNPLLIRWMEFLNVRSEHDMEDLKTKYDLPEEILIALEELDKLSQDPNMRMEALNKEMWIRDQIDMIDMVKEAKKTMAEADKKFIEADKKFIEADKKFIEADKKFIEADKKFIEADNKMAEADRKITEADNKITEMEIKLIKTAKNLKELGFDNEFIKDTTGLDIETIKKL